jgi:hypothetical protein
MHSKGNLGFSHRKVKVMNCIKPTSIQAFRSGDISGELPFFFIGMTSIINLCNRATLIFRSNAERMRKVNPRLTAILDMSLKASGLSFVEPCFLGRAIPF